MSGIRGGPSLRCSDGEAAVAMAALRAREDKHSQNPIGLVKMFVWGFLYDVMEKNQMNLLANPTQVATELLFFFFFFGEG